MHKLSVRMLQASVFLLAQPASASAAERLLKPIHIFGDSAPLQKAIILGLVASIVAVAVIAALRFTSRAESPGGSCFVSALRTGGPLLGLLGAVYSALNGFIGIANVPVTPTLRIVAPGVAESLFVLGLGVLAGIAAVFAHAFIEKTAAAPRP